MISYAPTASAVPAIRAGSAARLAAAAGLTVGGLILAGFGIAIPIVEGFVGRGAFVASPSDAALLASVAPVAPLLLLAGLAHIAVGLAVATGRALGVARGLATVDALAGLAVVGIAAIAGTSATGDARTDLAGAGFVTLIAAIAVATALRAGDAADTLA